MPKKVRVNVVAMNTPTIERREVSGRSKIVVSSATLPDDIVMNGYLYPSEEIEKAFATLENTPAPLGHPHLSGEFISASHTEAMIRFGVGAYNSNVRREGGRVLLDKVIDEEYAKNSDRGRRLLDHIAREDPIHTSTGLVCTVEERRGTNNSGQDYVGVARDMYFDHDAILLDEQGAGRPEQGVGMLVNSDVSHARHEGEKLEVVNSEYTDDQLEWIAREAVRVLDEEEKLPIVERVVSAIRSAFRGETETVSNEEDDMSDDNNLAAKIDGLSGEIQKMPDTIANAITKALEPITNTVTEMQNKQKEQDETERTDLINKLVEAKDMDEETAKELSTNSLRRRVAALLTEKQNANRTAAPIGSRSGRTNSQDRGSSYMLPGQKKEA